MNIRFAGTSAVTRNVQGRSIAAFVLVVGVVALVSGCASKPQVVPSSGPREATTAAQVKIHSNAPKKYEVLGTLNSPSPATCAGMSAATPTRASTG
jgi:hypothetical protein